mgnify:CR=1 FL=1
MEKDELSFELINKPGIGTFEERFPWIGGDLQTLRDTFISEKISSVKSSEVLIPVPSLPFGKLGAGNLLAYLEEPEDPLPINGLVLILHGLGGSTRRQGFRRMARSLLDSGFVVLKLNLRGADPCRNLVPGTYAAECNSDLFPVLGRAREIADSFSDRYRGAKDNVPVYGAGISLGGTILLNACLSSGFSSATFKPTLDGLVCISSPLNLFESSESIQRFRNIVYQRWLLKRLVRQTISDPFGIDDVEYRALKDSDDRAKTVNDIRSFDSYITAPRWGYKDVNDYYLKASPFFSLAENKNNLPPILIIQSKDDPWVPSKSAETLNKFEVQLDSNLRRKIQVVLTNHGGHNGFHGKEGCWGDKLVKSWLLNL